MHGWWWCRSAPVSAASERRVPGRTDATKRAAPHGQSRATSTAPTRSPSASTRSFGRPNRAAKASRWGCGPPSNPHRGRGKAHATPIRPRRLRTWFSSPAGQAARSSTAARTAETPVFPAMSGISSAAPGVSRRETSRSADGMAAGSTRSGSSITAGSLAGRVSRRTSHPSGRFAATFSAILSPYFPCIANRILTAHLPAGCGPRRLRRRPPRRTPQAADRGTTARMPPSRAGTGRGEAPRAAGSPGPRRGAWTTRRTDGSGGARRFRPAGRAPGRGPGSPRRRRDRGGRGLPPGRGGLSAGRCAGRGVPSRPRCPPRRRGNRPRAGRGNRAAGCSRSSSTPGLRRGPWRRGPPRPLRRRGAPPRRRSGPTARPRPTRRAGPAAAPPAGSPAPRAGGGRGGGASSRWGPRPRPEAGGLRRGGNRAGGGRSRLSCPLPLSRRRPPSSSRVPSTVPPAQQGGQLLRQPKRPLRGIFGEGAQAARGGDDGGGDDRLSRDPPRGEPVQDPLHPRGEGFRRLGVDRLPRGGDHPEGDPPAPYEESVHLLRVQKEGVGILVRIEGEVPRPGGEDEPPVGVRAAVDAAEDPGEPLEDLVEGGHHILAREGEDRGPHRGEVRLVEDQDHVFREGGEPRRLPLGSPEEILHQHVPPHGVVEDRLLLPVAHHEPERHGTRHLALHRRVGTPRRPEQFVQTRRALRRHREGLQGTCQERLVERLGAAEQRLPALHEELFPRHAGAREGGGELRVHVLEGGAHRELGPIGNLGEPGEDLPDGGFRVDVREAADSRARERTGQRRHVVDSVPESAARYPSSSVCGRKRPRWYSSMKAGSEERSWYRVAGASSSASLQRRRFRKAPMAPAREAFPSGTNRGSGKGGNSPMVSADRRSRKLPKPPAM